MEGMFSTYTVGTFIPIARAGILSKSSPAMIGQKYMRM